MANSWKRDLGNRSKLLVVLSGDVHHFALHRLPELSYVTQYLDIINQVDFSCTIFLTGLCIEENIHKVDTLMREYQGCVEFGGHTYSAHYVMLGGYKRYLPNLCRPLRFSLPKKLATLYYFLDVSKCVNAFAKLGYTCISWRTHVYRRSPTLYSQLLRFGFRVVSDAFSDTFKPFFDLGLLQVPITLADDKLLPADVAFHSPIRLFKLLKGNILNIVKKGSSACLQLHPLYMKVMGFERMRDLIKPFYEHSYTSLKMKELLTKYRDI